MTINFVGFSNAAYIFFTFSHLLDIRTFRCLNYLLLDFTFSHLLDIWTFRFLNNSIIAFYIFTSFEFLNFWILAFSLLSFLLWLKGIHDFKEAFLFTNILFLKKQYCKRAEVAEDDYNYFKNFSADLKLSRFMLAFLK